MKVTNLEKGLDGGGETAASCTLRCLHAALQRGAARKRPSQRPALSMHVR